MLVPENIYYQQPPPLHPTPPSEDGKQKAGRFNPVAVESREQNSCFFTSGLLALRIHEDQREPTDDDDDDTYFLLESYLPVVPRL